jgi:hypothetical protein
MAQIERVHVRRNSTRSASHLHAAIANYVLPGEDASEFEQCWNWVFGALQPRNILEEFWAEDVACIQWELQRFRRLKGKVLSFRASDYLRKVLPPCMEADYEEEQESSEVLSQEGGESSNQMDAGSTEDAAEDDDPSFDVEVDFVQLRAAQLADDWKCGDSDAVEEVQRLLQLGNRSLDEALVPAFSDKLELIEAVDHMILGLEMRRNAAVREFDRHRSSVAALVSHLDERETTSHNSKGSATDHDQPSQTTGK